MAAESGAGTGRNRNLHLCTDPIAAMCEYTVVPRVGALLAVAIFPAPADDGKQRYVSGAGRDQGDCLNRFRPCRTLSYAIARAGKAYSEVAEGDYADQETADCSISCGRRTHRRRLQQIQRLLGEECKRTDLPDRRAARVPRRFEAAGFTVIVDSKDIASRTNRSDAQARGAVSRVRAEPRCCTLRWQSVRRLSVPLVSLQSHVSLQDLRPSSSAATTCGGTRI